MEHSSFSIDEQPYASLFKIYDHEFLSISISKVFANVPKVELLPAIVTVTFPSLTVTSVMILLENAFTMATTYIYWLQRTQKATCLYFLYSILHQSMILMGFWKLLPLEKMVSLSAKQDEK